MGSRQPIAVATAVAAAVAAVSVAAPAHAGDAPQPSAHAAANASVQLVECSRGRRPRDRWAAFRGEMAQVAGGDRMRMRFTLLDRVGRGAWTPVRAHGLGVWHDSRPGVGRFAYNQRVLALERATAYRMHVAFRWYDAAGRRISAGDARSRPCRQRGRLPNLLVRGDVLVRPGPTSQAAVYAVRVANNGRGIARGVDLLLRVDGVDVETRAVGTIRPGGQRVVRFSGPACGSVVEAHVDPADAIRELSERDNVASTVCPAAG